MDVGSPLGSKMAPWSTIFSQQSSKKSLGRRNGTLLEPIWARFGAENAPRTQFHRSGVAVGRFWKDVGRLLASAQEGKGEEIIDYINTNKEKMAQNVDLDKSYKKLTKMVNTIDK